MRFLTVLIVFIFHLFHTLSLAVPLAKRATLTQVTNFGSNPAGIRMYIYVPDAVASSPGIVVSLHGASGNAQQQFQSTPYAALAEQYGFIVIYPESPQGAWDATSSKSLLHDGGGASQSIANMARYASSTYQANANQVFNTMADAYPDLFKGAIIYSAGSSADIRSMYPGYTGTYPKLQLYLGSQDTIIGSSAFNSTLAAWASVLGYDTTPDQVVGNTPVQDYTTYVLGSKLQGIWAEGVGHPVPTQGDNDMKWWGFAK
ncbi:alpha/beta hydrolase family esterase [Aspergillus aculeatinus CBS 121060]|uniref:Uncharacterized protein n=1 Tax=Aspergillus aculeatinus CBS 121060 TaxID=1448322 RepID=A0ACD1HPU9_9EURO|nr:hypothetical protein BO66DRAFT_407231 [Aspergillus aculeatinus CBS 121060]RAH75417.1 hypothetical protein BO66DRAFT_407231 [Aspergillus aculeatinus CBS 121060]